MREYWYNEPTQTERHGEMDKLILTLGWAGSAFMIGFSFTLYVPAGIIGLILLNVQAVDNKLWNLVGLNLASIFGLCLQLT
jgi:hypothetical protein